MTPTCVIVGGGQAAAQVAVSLRQLGYAGGVTMLCDEPAIPYHRPPLSKDYLSGQAGEDRLTIRPSALYEKLGIEVRLGARVSLVDRPKHRVELLDGNALDYETLVLATGARPQRLPLPGGDHGSVHYLRGVSDADRLRERLTDGRRLVVVGGGYMGLEAAAAAVQRGAHVTVLEALPRVMSRVSGAHVASFLTNVHRSRGVEIATESAVTEFVADDAGGLRVLLDHGRQIQCDEVLVAVGVVPNVELAAACGLRCDNGIVVDECGGTDDPAIFAAGDCTSHPNPILDRRLRLESVHNAVEQAKTVARTITGDRQPYAQVPWFYSDQYDVKLQTVGLFQGAEHTIVRGSPESGQFAVLYVARDSVIAVDAVSSPREFVLGRRLLGESPTGSVPVDDWPAIAASAAAAPTATPA